MDEFETYLRPIGNLGQMFGFVIATIQMHKDGRFMVNPEHII